MTTSDSAGSDPDGQRLVGPSIVGRTIVRLSWAVTTAFVGLSGVAVVAAGTRYPIAGIDVAIFAAGCLAMLGAFARAVERSRNEIVSVPGVFFLAEGAAPKAIRRQLLASAALQTIVALVAASVRPYTAVAFGILVPMFGLGMIGLWGARHGTFPARHHERSPA